jgi:hypothetical protein
LDDEDAVHRLLARELRARTGLPRLRPLARMATRWRPSAQHDQSASSPAIFFFCKSSGNKQQRQKMGACASMLGGGAPAKVLTLLHFNDVYNIEPGTRDPCGGAARFAWKVRALPV